MIALTTWTVRGHVADQAAHQARVPSLGVEVMCFGNERLCPSSPPLFRRVPTQKKCVPGLFLWCPRGRDPCNPLDLQMAVPLTRPGVTRASTPAITSDGPRASAPWFISLGSPFRARVARSGCARKRFSARALARPSYGYDKRQYDRRAHRFIQINRGGPCGRSSGPPSSPSVPWC